MTNPSSLFDLTGKIAIVTGASGQLGGEYTKILLFAGAKVAAFDIRLDNPKSILNSLPQQNLLQIEVDITNKNSIEHGLQMVRESLGNPSILINNAAIDAPPNASDIDTGSFESYPESSWDTMMNVNLKGMFLCCQVIGGDMAQRKGGSIINVSSIYGILSPDQRIYEYKEKPFFKPVTYSVTKSGVLNLTRYLATYWAKKNIRVNTITLAGVFNNQDETFLENYTAKVPLGRMARADEFNGTILLLASEASSYITGSNIVIDGGFSAW